MVKKQVYNSNFAVVVKEIEELVKDGYSVIHDGVESPYHAVLGAFIVNLEKAEDTPNTPTDTVSSSSSGNQQRGRKKS